LLAQIPLPADVPVAPERKPATTMAERCGAEAVVPQQRVLPLPRVFHGLRAGMATWVRRTRGGPVALMAREWAIPEVRWYSSSHMGFLAHRPGVVAEMRRVVDRYADGASAPGAARIGDGRP
jgi:hypothetical protein